MTEEGMIVYVIVLFVLSLIHAFANLVIVGRYMGDESTDREAMHVLTYYLGRYVTILIGMFSPIAVLWMGAGSTAYYSIMQAMTVVQLIILIYDQIYYSTSFKGTMPLNTPGVSAAAESVMYIGVIVASNSHDKLIAFFVGFLLGVILELLLYTHKNRWLGSNEAIGTLIYGIAVRLIYLLQLAAAIWRWGYAFFFLAFFTTTMVGLFTGLSLMRDRYYRRISLLEPPKLEDAK